MNTILKKRKAWVRPEMSNLNPQGSSKDAAGGGTVEISPGPDSSAHIGGGDVHANIAACGIGNPSSILNAGANGFASLIDPNGDGCAVGPS